MASNAPMPTAGPLPMMSKISPNSFIYRPLAEALSEPPASSAPPQPKMILVCSWMGAKDQHIVKYIARYQATYPASQILLVKCDLVHIRDHARAIREIQPAVLALRALFGGGSSSSSAATPSTAAAPELLAHIFSNGGSSILSRIYDEYKPALLPRHVTVLDSCPGQYSYNGSLAAMTSGLSQTWRVLLAPFVHAVIISYVLSYFVLPWGGADPLALWAASHNDRGLNGTEARRAYIYSEDDKLVAHDDVEAHGEDARAKGFAVRMEKFVGSAHVAHVRADGERYWRIVDETWRG